jgi:cystathionine beta-lyase/cystathionine gamma-synthase
VTVPIYQTSTYAQDEVGRHRGYEYSRTGNPTRTALETCLAGLEGGAWGLAFASGMAATASILYLLEPGDRVLAADDLYGGTYRLFERVLRQYGLQFDYVDMCNLDGVERALHTRTRLVWIESPTNPFLKVIDIRRVVDLAHGVGAPCAVDNTFASPFLQQPLALGADLVLHSTTKYLGGHSDIVGGAVVGNDPQMGERLAFIQNAAGAVPGPMDCWLVLRGMKTLALRMERHCHNGLAVARFLAAHRHVSHVYYPGLPSHPGHDVARNQMRNGFGGMLAFTLSDAAMAREVARRTRLFILAESLGGVESLIEVPAAMTHASVTGSPLEVPQELVRLSVGIEHIDDLLADLDQALAAART